MRKQQTYMEMILKFDSLQMKREDNLERYISNEKATEYSKEKRLQKLFEKMKKIEEIK
jgi:hypothetical protein